MSKPHIHSEQMVKRFGGNTCDYDAINHFMDSSKSVIADNRHRIFFHSSFGIFTVEKLFGHSQEKLDILRRKYNLPDEIVEDIAAYADFVRTSECNTIINSQGKKVAVRDIAEDHTLSDFNGKFIPTAQDYIQEMPFLDWMNNGKGFPSSFKELEMAHRKRFNLKPLAKVD